MDCSPPGTVLEDSPGKRTGVDCHSLLQGIFPTQGSNPGLLNCRWILYCLSHQDSLQNMGRSIQISAYKEQRGFSEGKSFQEKELDMKMVDKALVTEGKGKSEFSMVSACRLISCKDKRTHVWGSNMETPMAEWNQNRGRVGPVFELNTAFWQLLDTSASTWGWVKFIETGRSDFSLFEVLGNSAGAFRRLLCLSMKNSHGSTSGEIQH